MFFVVYLQEADEYAVVPENWIRDLKQLVFEKFVNAGLNSDQNHLCYFSTQENAIINEKREPNPKFEPKFNAPRATQFPCNEGTYECRIVKYHRKFKSRTIFECKLFH